ncbi:CDP-alcohol phosphatidyltransferase family protein [Gilvibacter sediminis]|uniref:CDP-alcohol phosphatidyltransferase family protein n=1 Tax=Gilvibacter sediminis TaxID=379071 RepID=UPI002350A843|nr:CDP-alcohol phosphatidyltransferase family protein [Gilvibacter sediminis]MDC7999241.1 CDP-alcohol phosphatidyltransferase family protein [Gilvibacter sediminis]
MRKYIPHLFTSLNLCCGCIAAIFIIIGQPLGAVFFMFLGIFFDFFDGLAARALKVTTEVGVQLDSLADVITSGLVPSLMMIHLMINAEWDGTIGTYLDALMVEKNPLIPEELVPSWLPVIGLLIVISAAYRLAKFNVDERQTSGFIGLPTPANAIFIASLILITEDFSPAWAYELLTNSWVLVGVTIVFSLLMHAEIPLFSLKFKSFGLKENGFVYGFVIATIAALLLFKIIAIPFIIIGYIVLSIVKNTLTK